MPFKSSVKPIAVPLIWWEELLKSTYDLTGMNLIKCLDGCKIEFSNHAKFIIALEHVNKKPIEILPNSQAALHHLYFSFLIEAPISVIIKLMEISMLPTVSFKSKTKGARVALVSGTLSEWKANILSICTTTYSDNTSAELRHIANTCLEYFSIMGLKSIFKNYQTRALSDGTFLMEHIP